MLDDPDGDIDTGDGTVGTDADEVTLGYQWYVSKVTEPLADEPNHWVEATGLVTLVPRTRPLGTASTRMAHFPNDNNAPVDEG